jgi:hypothetical protein
VSRLVPLIAVALVAAVLIAGAAVLQIEGQRQATAVAQRPSGDCAPRPCAEASGYVVRVSDVHDDGGVVTLRVAFDVHGRGKMHAEPSDFSLRDSAQHRHRPWFDGAQCRRWPRTDVPDGGHLGPMPLCFHVEGAPGPMALRWDPDLGPLEAFAPAYDLPLP